MFYANPGLGLTLCELGADLGLVLGRCPNLFNNKKDTNT